MFTGYGKVEKDSFDAKTGELVAVMCGVHKKYEVIEDGTGAAIFSARTGSTTGLNSVCKEGASAYTKATRELKNAKEKIKQDVFDEAISLPDGKRAIADLEAAPIAGRVDGMGWNTIEEVANAFGIEITTVAPSS